MEHIKLYVPIMDNEINETTKEQYVRMFREVGTDTVFLAPERNDLLFCEDERRTYALRHLQESIRYFAEQGFEVGVWVQAFGFGISMNEEAERVTKDCTKITSVFGSVAGDAFCPEDETYMTRFLRMIRDIAHVGADMILLDDDLCLSVRPGLGCFCDRHKRLLAEAVGEPFPTAHPETVFFTGQPNQWRRAWDKVMHDSLCRFCARVRQTVDEINGTVRLGFCAGYTSWDIECADALELTRILAGNTKPFLRLTGAPYWVTRDINRFRTQRLHSIVEFARAQVSWLADSGVEVFTETDSYPRPRYHVPASVCECFDMITRASGGTGCLKYLFDYVASPTYETGYAKLHIRNRELARFIDTHFQSMTAGGIKVIDPMRKFTEMTLPTVFPGETKLMETAFSPAATMVSLQGLPTCFAGDSDCIIAFGETIKAVDCLPKKVILDVPAARFLAEKGIDVGFDRCEGAGFPFYESYEGERVTYFNLTGTFYNIHPKDSARVLSVFEDINGGRYPGVLQYNNGATDFLIFAFDGYTLPFGSDCYLPYFRQKQLLDFAGDMPHIENEPNLYILCKRDGEKESVLVANLGEDSLYDAELQLDGVYTGMECYGSDGELMGDKVILHGRLAPYDMAAVSLYRFAEDTEMSEQPGYHYLAIGNSLTRHGLAPFWWNEIGMAATVAEKDYVHLVTAYLRSRYGSVETDTFNFADWERGAADVPLDRNAQLPQLDKYLSVQPQLITVQLSENAGDLSTFTEDTVSLIQYLKEKVPTATVLLIDDFACREKGAMKRIAAEKCGIPFISLSDIQGDPAYMCGLGTTVYDPSGHPHTVEHPGVAGHPGDKGMQYMADSIIAVLETVQL